MKAVSPPPLTDAELDEMQARADAATAGPWLASQRDGRFIAAARTDIPRLIVEVRKAKQLLRRACGEIYLDSGGNPALVAEIKSFLADRGDQHDR